MDALYDYYAYDNYYNDITYDDDILTLYEEVDVSDQLWRSLYGWDDIQELITQSNRKIMQKCADIGDYSEFESFCLCKYIGHKTTYACQEKEPQHYATKSAFSQYDSGLYTLCCCLLRKCVQFDNGL